MKKQIIIVLVLAVILSTIIPFGSSSVNAQTSTSLILQLQAQVIKLQTVLRSLIQGSQSNPVSNVGAVFPLSQTIANGTISVEPLTQTELAEIRSIKEIISKNNGRDYSSLNQALVSRRGNLKRIISLCTQFDPIFCYKWASKENPSLRSNLCQAMSFGIEQQYRGRVSAERLKTSITNHQRECQLGIPQFGR